MSVAPPELQADASGVWRVASNGHRLGVPWTEAHQLVGYALDGITEIHVVLEVVTDTGHALELQADWPGVPRQLDFPGVLPRKPMLPLILA